MVTVVSGSKIVKVCTFSPLEKFMCVYVIVNPFFSIPLEKHQTFQKDFCGSGFGISR
jgi:hypothetical protein